MAKGSKPVGDARDLVNALVEEFGGWPAFLNLLAGETKDLPRGHQTRVKVMYGLFELAVKLNESGRDDAQTLGEKQAELEELERDEGEDD